MNLKQLMDGGTELYLPLVDNGVKLENDEHCGLRVRMKDGESVAAGMGDGAEAVLWKLLQANADKILSQLASRIVEARSHELKNRADAGTKKPITLRDIRFGFGRPLPGLPVSLRVNNHAEQCDCGIEVDVGLDWDGRWSQRVGGLRWAEARLEADLRDVLRELLNSCAPTILDALIDGVIDGERNRLAAKSRQRDSGSVKGDQV